MLPYRSAFFIFLILNLIAIHADGRPAHRKTPKKAKSLIQAERSYLSHAFLLARPFMQSDLHPTAKISATQLRRILLKSAKKRKLTAKEIKVGLWWLSYVTKHAKRLSKVFHLPHPHITATKPVSLVHIDQVWLPPAEASMWLHCQLHFHHSSGHTLIATGGYRTQAYLSWKLSQTDHKLSQALHANFPGFQYQQAVPLITFKISPPKPRLTKGLSICSPFGLHLINPQHLHFTGRDQLYQPILNKLPPDTRLALYHAMIRLQFFPSPQGLKVILGMAQKESSFIWDPVLTKLKKKALSKQFLIPFKALRAGLNSSISKLMVPKSLSTDSNQLKINLESILSSRSTEYDFYRWTRKAYTFIQHFLSQYSQLAKFGGPLVHLKHKLERFRYEPQTFGLWQINVNHLIETLEQNPKWRKAYQEIFSGRHVRREALIQSLSGLPHAKMTHPKTIRLIIQLVLAPRYQDHLLGKPKDLNYFVAENLTGPLSTFRAALQQKLAYTMHTPLTLDGDLAFYRPYSRQIDRSKTSKTQKLLLKYIQKHPKKFRSHSPNRWIRQLCAANTRGSLLRSRLYQSIMQQSSGNRIFPQISSRLYHQSPKSYAHKVIKLSRTY